MKLVANLKASGLAECTCILQRAEKVSCQSALIQEQIEEDCFAQILEEINLVKVQIQFL